MAWRKLEDTFHSDRKIRKLANELDIIEPHAAGHIATLWSWALLHAPDGDLTKFDVDDIEYGAKWNGAIGDFVNACVLVRLIDRTDGGGLLLHNWLERGGSYAESHRKRLERKAKKQGDLSGTVQDCPGQSGTVLDCPEMSALEENRIEENRSICDSAAGAADHSSDALTKPTKVERMRDDIQDVWQHYRGLHPGTAKQLKSNRKEYQLVRARLEDFSAEQLKSAINGYHKSAFHSGDNPQGKRYLSLALIMRDISHVQQGIEMLAAKPSDNGRPRALDPVESLGDTCD